MSISFLRVKIENQVILGHFVFILRSIFGHLSFIQGHSLHEHNETQPLKNIIILRYGSKTLI